MILLLGIWNIGPMMYAWLLFGLVHEVLCLYLKSFQDMTNLSIFNLYMIAFKKKKKFKSAISLCMKKISLKDKSLRIFFFFF